MFPYISGIVICLGLILHMMLRLPKLVKDIVKGRVNKVVALAFILLALPHHAHAATAFDYSAFKEIPVLDQGRVKPLSTVAQNYLKEFYGASSLPDMNSTEWFAELIFTPDTAYNRNIFNIADPRVVDALALPRRQHHAYSYHEVGMALLQNPKAWQRLFVMPEDQLTPSQKELMNVYSETKLYGQLARSLSLFFPDFKIPAGPIAMALGVLPDTALTYDEMLSHETALDNLAKSAMQRSRDNPQLPPLLRASDARAILDLDKQLDTIADDRQNDAFKVIPPQWESEKAGKLWYSPWGITFQGQGAPDVVKFLALWKNLVGDYRRGDTNGFLIASKAIDAESLRMAGDSASTCTLRLEVAYNDYQPFKISMGFYALAFVLVLASLMFRGDNKFYYASAGSLLLGFVFHGIGLLSRMIIMGRPPVTNLYASIIFVGFIVALVGMAYEWRMRNRIGVIVAAIAGLLLQFLGLSYDAEGETMGMLIAVLDTNFWLSTHVVCMTTGYACCILGALMAHIYLVLRMTRPGAPQLDELSRNIRGIGYLALTFASVGTILGGIWADQSWGRFWGWDPKENGALLICLWLLFLAHGRMAGRLKELGYNIGMALTAVIVSLAWFGVNLLAVGLHSYGFTQGAATGLFAFIGGEILFAVASYVVIAKWRRASL
jgi:ABC-type transport system involved in cytochrome c biogenesis permease subunit